MKLSAKIAVAAALGLGAANAFATISLPTSGNGTLMLSLFSNSDDTPFSYAFDTGLTFNSLTPTFLSTPGTTTFNLTGLATDFASAAGQAALSNLVFDVTASAQTGGVATAGGFHLDTTFAPSVSLATITSIQSGAINSAVGTDNSFLSNFGATNPSFTTSPTAENYLNATYNSQLNTFAVNAAAGVGNSLAFYQLANNRGTSSPGQTPVVYAGTWSVNLTNDTLSYTVPSSAVPLPPSVWLMVSGLAGVAILGRRRKDGKSAVAV